jgi:decaprenyl-phosphate phosphoribosyltransferase
MNLLSAPTMTPEALLRTARPRQWIKNLLVLAAPAGAGALLVPSVGVATALAFAAFTLAAAGTYFLNDTLDVAADRRHPAKRLRPVAAGQLSVGSARTAAVVFALAGLVLALAVSWQLAACVAGYLAATTLYSAALKHVPVLDVLLVAGGFLLRAAGGAAATHVPVSSWLMLVILLGSLFVVIAKRSGEHTRTGAGGRRVLAGYPAGWLQQIQSMALTGTVVAYAAWAFQYLGQDVALPLLAVSLVPFLAGLMRYSLLAARDGGETPENLVTTDRFLLGTGFVWAVIAGSAIYLA